MAAASPSIEQGQFCCSVCLDVLRDPATIPCGHSYCLGCIDAHWNRVKPSDQYSCPQCRRVFQPRPLLSRNTVLAEALDQFQTSRRPAAATAREAKCGACAEPKNRAVKFCRACSRSYCVAHLRVHNKRFRGKAHALVRVSDPPTEMPRPRGRDADGGSTKQMGTMFNLLEQYRLESYYDPFLQLGVKDLRDLLDGVTDEDLINLGLSRVEKNRFSAMKNFIGSLGAPGCQVPTVATVQKSMKAFALQYTYPKCPQPKHIRDMDPAQNTVEDLMLRICHLENVSKTTGVCLYTIDGMPLTDDPFFNTWSLKDRHIQSGAVIYSIFTPKENLRQAPQMPQHKFVETSGEDVVRCHIMLKGDYDVMVNLNSDTITSLRLKLANASGIPAHVLHYKGQHRGNDALQSYGICERSTVAFSLYTVYDETAFHRDFFIDDVVPSVQQTQKGISVFLSSLYVVKDLHSTQMQKKLMTCIRKLTGCNPLAQSLHQLLCRNEKMTRNQKVSVVEGLYMLFRELLPQPGSERGEKVIKDTHVFENSLYCWAYLISKATKLATNFENYASVTLTSEDDSRFCEPVRVPGVPGAFERAHVLQKIKDGKKIPNCTEEVLRETSLQRATDIERILLSLPSYIRTYPLWIPNDKMIGQNFQVNIQRTFGKMVEGLKSHPRLNVTPPLRLKELGQADVCLVLLSEDNLGVSLYKDKGSADTIRVHNCLDGKETVVDVNVLAAQ